MSDEFNSYFTVNLEDNEDYAILITVKQLQHKIKTYVRYGEMPTHKKYDFKASGDSYIEIKPDNPAYHKNGTYFVMVQADPDLIDLLITKEYSFTVTWRSQNVIPHLNT